MARLHVDTIPEALALLEEEDFRVEGRTRPTKLLHDRATEVAYYAPDYSGSQNRRRAGVVSERHDRGYDVLTWTEVACCGAWLACEGMTTTCPHCDADYNWNGQRLAPRSQWGEETGEHWTECY